MPTIKIYHQNTLQENKPFKNVCWIVLCNSGEIISIVDGENDRGGPGVYQSRVYEASDNPEIVVVFADWQLIIDGIAYPRKFYESITDVKGKIVQLQYKDYELVFDFS